MTHTHTHICIYIYMCIYAPSGLFALLEAGLRNESEEEQIGPFRFYDLKNSIEAYIHLCICVGRCLSGVH